MRSSGYMPWAPVASTWVSTSVASMCTGGVRLPNASQAVIASEYGSSPVDAAHDQICSGARWARASSSSRSFSK